MSESPGAPAGGGTKQTDGTSITVSEEVAQELTTIAADRQVEVHTLVNQILRQYIASAFRVQPEQTAADFLLSLGGIFDSGTKDTSAEVDKIVSEFVVHRRSQSSP